jgi:hypothetical protein
MSALAIVAAGLVAAAAPGSSRGSTALVGQQLAALMDVPRVIREDCILAVGILLEGNRVPQSIGQLTSLLAGRRIARKKDLENLKAPATRGYACLLFMRAMGSKGGLKDRVFGSNQHTAYKHLLYLGMVSAGGSVVKMSGPELVGLLSLARKRVAAGPDGKPRRVP